MTQPSPKPTPSSSKSWSSGAIFRSQSVLASSSLSLFEGISWSHKFGSLNRRRKNAGGPSMVITSCPHLEVPGWLTRLDLDEYQDKFKQFNGVEDFLYYSEADIKKLGIRNNAHRARIISSLVALRENPST
ncbi:hypothetical protein quinque_015765, partial [Culex quinquefasciatus]